MAWPTLTSRAASTRKVVNPDEYGPIPSCRQGDRCVVGGTRGGVIRFVGEIAQMGVGIWIGVQLDEPTGNTNGRVQGRCLFNCPQKFGLFCRPAEVSVKDSSILENTDATALGRPGSPSQTGEEPAPPLAVAAASASGAAGRGLVVAVVNQPAQFLITARDSHGRRRKTGGDAFSAQVRGVRPAPCNLRVKLRDQGNGLYSAEYVAVTSGELRVHVSLGSGSAAEPIGGSPFIVQAVTLRPDPEKCVLEGDATRIATARKQMSFDICFVDELGHATHAEELDVRLERIEPMPEVLTLTLT